jgi:hypothetical protein
MFPTISCLPSGVHATPRGPVAGSCNLAPAPPVTGITVNGYVLAVLEYPRNAIHLPSGDSAGNLM